MAAACWNTRTRRAELNRSEFLWLRDIGLRPGRAAWELDDMPAFAFEAYQRIAGDFQNWCATNGGTMLPAPEATPAT
ncbi:hypothetical protein ACIBI9_46105 [Nonomuraea sp. NPDC050451]|uniref:hypothetical protein n=1 Tax=Nonomuraea sp. NPDC050451 TaxID=3364364 RepID=UPI00379F0ED5